MSIRRDKGWHSVNGPVVIDYYSDLLCVWAWIAQRRCEELQSRWGDRLELHPAWVDVFGDTHAKMSTAWQGRGGFDGFADHVHKAAARYESAPVHPAVWRSVRPTSSATGHLVLKAAALVAPGSDILALAADIRRAFFVDAVDISSLPRLLEILQGRGLPAEALRDCLTSGQALAALLSDYRRAEQRGIKGSPTWLMNDGRQLLYGNVGYRILHANVEELLHNPDHEASWC
jgi:predicted DsbA family dithiol-disulfide isomerase